MMLNFMEPMKQDFRISPHRTPGVTNTASGATTVRPANRNREFRSGKSTTNIICFNCGASGHFSLGCTNSPLPYAEQKRIRDQLRIERDAKQHEIASAGGTTGQSAASQAFRNTTPAGARSVSAAQVVSTQGEPDVIAGSRITEVSSDDDLAKVNPVSCIKEVSVVADKKFMGQACATLMRMPAVAAIFEKAMVNKRVRVDDDHYEQPGRSSKQPRTQGPATRSGGAGSGR